ncbi:hypothetical protein NCLIV_041430, partial [Neospora caninum Liverpool]
MRPTPSCSWVGAPTTTAGAGPRPGYSDEVALSHRFPVPTESASPYLTVPPDVDAPNACGSATESWSRESRRLSCNHVVPSVTPFPSTAQAPASVPLLSLPHITVNVCSHGLPTAITRTGPSTISLGVGGGAEATGVFASARNTLSSPLVSVSIVGMPATNTGSDMTSHILPSEPLPTVGHQERSQRGRSVTPRSHRTLRHRETPQTTHGHNHAYTSAPPLLQSFSLAHQRWPASSGVSTHSWPFVPLNGSEGGAALENSNLVREACDLAPPTRCDGQRLVHPGFHTASTSTASPSDLSSVWACGQCQVSRLPSRHKSRRGLSASGSPRVLWRAVSAPAGGRRQPRNGLPAAQQQEQCSEGFLDWANRDDFTMKFVEPSCEHHARRGTTHRRDSSGPSGSDQRAAVSVQGTVHPDLRLGSRPSFCSHAPECVARGFGLRGRCSRPEAPICNHTSPSVFLPSSTSSGYPVRGSYPGDGAPHGDSSAFPSSHRRGTRAAIPRRHSQGQIRTSFTPCRCTRRAASACLPQSENAVQLLGSARANDNSGFPSGGVHPSLHGYTVEKAPTRQVQTAARSSHSYPLHVAPETQLPLHPSLSDGSGFCTTPFLGSPGAVGEGHSTLEEEITLTPAGCSTACNSALHTDVPETGDTHGNAHVSLCYSDNLPSDDTHANRVQVTA